jgi:hypothetical protein
VGYIETSKAYRIFIPVKQKKVVSRDVKFEENFTSRKSRETSTVTKDEEQQAPKDEQHTTASSSRS